MDPVSGVASVIAVVQLAQVIGGALKAYYGGAREARADIDRLYTSITSLEGVLVQAEAVGKSPHVHSLKTILLESCAFPRLRIELERIRVLLKAPKVKDILESIKNDIRHAQNDQDHQLVLKWLGNSVVDPSQEHNAARDKQEKGTGSWLVDSGELQSWALNENSILLLSGGAESGKSLLCSTVIESLKIWCRLQKHLISMVAYWYFSFATKETLNISNFLCSIMRDLCSKLLTIPSQVQDAWADANNGQQRPTNHELLEMLQIVLKSFDDVYVAVDALDEYPRSERALLLDLIQNLHNLENTALHIFISSRRDGEIARAVEEVAETTEHFQEVQVQGIRVKNDIEAYLDQRFNSRLFRRWAAEERREVTSRLSSQADGMFRLIALQLAALSKLMSTAKKRDSFDSIPSTLDAIYHRILDDVPAENVEIVRKALNWLVFSARPLTLAELGEAVIIKLAVPYLDPEERFDDEHCLLEILPSGFIRCVGVGRQYPLSRDSSDEDGNKVEDGGRWEPRCL